MQLVRLMVDLACPHRAILSERADDEVGKDAARFSTCGADATHDDLTAKSQSKKPVLQSSAHARSQTCQAVAQNAGGQGF